MILIYLQGGLGNQLFQYATGRALADLHGASLKLVTRGYKRSKELRSFKLHHFRIKATIASYRDERRIMLSNPLRYLRPHPQRPRVVQRHFHFDPAILKAPDNICLLGYWQSEKYFLNVESDLRRELLLRHELGGDNLALSRLISGVNAVSIHVRRGDYVSDPVRRAYHGTCSPAYYQKAIKRMTGTVTAPHFFIFSDDMAWAKDHLDTGYPTTFVGINSEDHDYEDFRLMSLCRHHIIANSSFSWWGAWLSNHPRKVVIAPQRWFKQTGHDTRDLLPDSWIQI